MWWKLQLTDDITELSDAGREHIATLIEAGFTEGELNEDDCDNDEDYDGFHVTYVVSAHR